MENKKVKYTSVGGQALIEGVMMRGKDKISIAVRKSDGEIILKTDPIKKGFLSMVTKIPIFRGIFAFISSMIIGIKALNYSAEFYDDGTEVEKGKFDLWVEKTFADKADSVYVFISMIFALAITVLFFLGLPALVSFGLSNFVNNSILLSLLEGIFKFALFIGYIFLISRMKEVKRVFQYHGAEHKSIRCFEAKEELTPENAEKYSRLHPRCGTSFLLIVVTISIIVFAFLGNFDTPILRVGLKMLFMPIVAGFAYEVIHLAGKSDNTLVRLVSYPGMMLQKITTVEPDLSQIEVALAALKEVIDIEKYNEEIN